MIDSVTTHTITASYSGDTNFTDSSNSMQQTVTQASTSVTIIDSSPKSVVDGNTVTFTASVSFTAGSGDLTGTVTFFEDGSTSLGTASFSGLSGSTTTFTTSSIEPAGQTHSITAVYVSDDSTNISGNTSAAFTETVQQTTSTTVTSAAGTESSNYGNTVTFTATVSITSSGTWAPTGTVTFLDGSDSLATASLIGTTASATYTTSSLGAATHTITAAYSGDDFDAADTPDQRIALLQTVSQTGTTTTVTSSTNGTSAFGQSVTFTATVTAGLVTFDDGGTVTFSDGSTSLGTASLSSGQATYSAPSSVIDSLTTHTITASYSGDTNFTDSSNSMQQTVNQASTSVTITGATPQSVVYGSSVTFTASVSFMVAGNGDLAGTVTFFDDSSTSLGTASFSGGLSGSTTTFTTSSSPIVPAGQTHSITAVYAPADSTNISGNTSAAFTETVQQTTSTTVTSAAAEPSGYGVSITLTATVNVTSSGTWAPTGTVTFLDGADSLGTASLSGGSNPDIATYTINSLPIATHTITAAYSGDDFDAPDTLDQRTPLVQTIGTNSTTTSVTSSTSASVFGQSVTFTATVTATANTFDNGGTVTFSDGSTSLGTASLNSNGQATYSAPSSVIDSVTTHTITASYSGDSNFSDSSNSVVQAVNKASTNTASVVISPISSSIFGQLVTFTTSVTASSPGSGTPTGTVTFYVDSGANVLGTGTLDSQGVATFTTTSLAKGYHNYDGAVYGGDSNFNESGEKTTGDSIQVIQASSTTYLASLTNTSVFGQPVTFTAVVTPSPYGGIATGTVTFSDGSTSLGTASVSSDNVATFTNTSSVITGIGTHTITAIYSGDTNVTGGSTENTVLQTVNQASTTTVLSPTYVSPSYFGQTVTYTVTVSPSYPGVAPTGTVTFEDGTSSIGTGTLTASGSDGVYTFTNSTLAYGTHTLSAVYTSDTNNFTGSTSNAVNQTVNQAVTATTLSPLNPSVVGQTVTFTATVTVTNPDSGVLTNGGTVTFTFSDGSSSIGTGTLDGSGVATFTTSSLAKGDYNVTAVYGGDTNYHNSSSYTLTQVVNPPSFQVTGLTQTATGFIADFNGLLNAGTTSAPILNLYDDAGGSLGPTDVTLIGNTGSGNITIRGSLVVTTVGGNNSQIQFIETGESGVQGSAAPSTLFGVLPTGTYTVTLRSATNGFQDTNSVLLGGIASFTGNTHSGNTTVDGIGGTTGLFHGEKVFGDGIPDNDTIDTVSATSITLTNPATSTGNVTLHVGSDYVTTFVVANPSSSVTVTLPDFARGAGQLVNVPNTDPADTTFSTGLPLRLYNSSSSDSQTITSVSLTLKYDLELVERGRDKIFHRRP